MVPSWFHSPYSLLQQDHPRNADGHSLGYCFNNGVTNLLRFPITKDLNTWRLGDHVNDTVVFLEQCLPWMRTLIPSKALYVSYPAIRGGWNIQCVPVAVGDRATKKPFPAEWLSNPESRPAGCTFVHPTGFLAAFATREDAEAAAELLTELVQK